MSSSLFSGKLSDSASCSLLEELDDLSMNENLKVQNHIWEPVNAHSINVSLSSVLQVGLPHRHLVRPLTAYYQEIPPRDPAESFNAVLLLHSLLFYSTRRASFCTNLFLGPSRLCIERYHRYQRFQEDLDALEIHKG